jgi:hypothetical protein
MVHEEYVDLMKAVTNKHTEEVPTLNTTDTQIRLDN